MPVSAVFRSDPYTVLPGFSTGWVTHVPGVAIVTKGAFTYYEARDGGCVKSEQYGPGQAYTHVGGLHMGVNESDSPTELVVVYFNMPHGGLGGVVPVVGNTPGTERFRVAPWGEYPQDPQRGIFPFVRNRVARSGDPSGEGTAKGWDRAVTTMDAQGRTGPPEDVGGPVIGVPSGPGGSAVPTGPVVPRVVMQLAVVEDTCATAPEPDVARRRFWNIVVPALAVSALAWVALVLWGGGHEMRRGLLTGGAALMSPDTMSTGTTGHAQADLAGLALPAGVPADAVPADGMDMSAMPGMHMGHGSMSMLGVDMSSLAPASVAYAGLFVWMWAVMVVAMMLPATLPSVRVFFAGDRTRRHCAGATFLSGCLATWALAGLAVYGLLVVLDQAVAQETATESRFALGLGAVCLLAAGLFQFSRSKQRLLGHVRGPFNCGDGPLRAGLHHGRRCLASCGPYMLAVALIGMMSLFWMALFAAVMLLEQAVEIVTGRGMFVARATGAVTVLVALGLLLSPTPLPLIG